MKSKASFSGWQYRKPHLQLSLYPIRKNYKFKAITFFLDEPELQRKCVAYNRVYLLILFMCSIIKQTCSHAGTFVQYVQIYLKFEVERPYQYEYYTIFKTICISRKVF